MSGRLSAEEFAAKSTEERDWAIYDSLGKGQDTMTGLRTDVDKNTHVIKDVGTSLDSHIKDAEVHNKATKIIGNPGNPGVKSRIKERKWQAIVGIITIITIIVTYHFGGG